MATLEDFFLYNEMEDMREAQERSSTTEYPYQKQFWESDSDSSSDSYSSDYSSDSEY